uniref:Uncharacterized protein n=1 Tax=Parascaris equorum TaxID=6256 RepID=A0A914RII8_PAREQ
MNRVPNFAQLGIPQPEEKPVPRKSSWLSSRQNVLGVEVFYIQETLNSQEVLGRMAAPMQSPHVYSKSAKREIRVIKGDLVRPIPLASLGMESDYEMTDWED